MAQTAKVRRTDFGIAPAEVSPIHQNQRVIGLARQAYHALQVGFVVAPIVAGLDKFFHLLTNWDQYLAPQIPQLLGVSVHSFMLGVGVIEIIAGVGVLFKPKIFAYVVSSWLVGIIVSLLLMGQFYDIALRDLGLAIGAFALGRLSSIFDRERRSGPSSG